LGQKSPIISVSFAPKGAFRRNMTCNFRHSMSLRHTVGELCMLAAGQHTLLLNEYHCKHGQHPCVYSTSMRLLHLYASTPPLCVYLTSMRLLHLYASTPPLCVYLTSMRLPHLYVSTPPLCVDPTSMCLHHLYLFNSAFNTW